MGSSDHSDVAIEARGAYTGKTDDHDLKDFMNPISTGVDGLQRVCDTLIINVLPWTSAEYDQLRGRLWRQEGTTLKLGGSL